jgi:hypothetical protein
MGWFKHKSQTTVPQTAMKYLRQKEGDKPIEIVNPFWITFAFLVVTPSDEQRHGSKLLDSLGTLLKYTQPAVWETAFALEDHGITFAKTLKNCVLIVEANESGFPYCRPENIHKHLQKLGLAASDSLVVNLAINSYDGGQTKTNLLVGFAFKDKEPCCYFPLRKGCVVPGVLVENSGGHVIIVGDVLGLYKSRQAM